jgi:hypothetical protein
MPIVAVPVTAMPIAHRAAPSEVTAIETRMAPIEARAASAKARMAPIEATTARSSCQNGSGQHGREKAAQKK